MAEYVSKSTLYSLCDPRGIVTLHVSDIDTLYSADVAPVRHGRWVKPVPGDGDPCCSECKAKQLYLPYVGYFYSKYCPYCGAKMAAKENDNEFD